MKRLLSSLNLLRTFEVAGRHLSFTLAAEELCITLPQSASKSAGWRKISASPCLNASRELCSLRKPASVTGAISSSIWKALIAVPAP